MTIQNSTKIAVFIALVMCSMSFSSLSRPSDGYNITEQNDSMPIIDYSSLEEPHDMFWSTEARALTGVQKFLVIDAKWPNHDNSRWTSAELEDLFDDTISDFYADASHNQITIDADVYSIEMPDNSDAYLRTRDDGRSSYSSFDVARDALETVDSLVNLNDYSEQEVIVVLNGPYFNGVYCGSCGTMSGLSENNGDWKYIVVSENDGKEGSLLTTDFTAPYNDVYHSEDFNKAWGRIAHEIGHMFGLSHTTAGYNNDYALMASLYPGQLTGYSMTAAVDWLPESRIYEPTPGTIEETVFLYPLERTVAPTEGDRVQLIRIPIDDNKYYLIETRARILADSYTHCSNYDDTLGTVAGINEPEECTAWDFTDDSLPEEGVLVSFVDTTLPTSGQGAQAVSIDHDGDGIQDGLKKAGETFLIDMDGKDGAIDVIQKMPNDAYEIKISYEVLSMTPPDIWMPDNPPWQVSSIWVDSPLNGLGIYQYHDGDNTIPNAGNGDNPWLGGENKVCTKVRNIGQTPSNSVPVTFKWKTQNMGVPSDSMTTIGTVNTGVISGGGFEDVCIDWTPEVEGIEYDSDNPIIPLHACIRVEVGPSLDNPSTIFNEAETNTENNQAQENIGHFETTSSSPFHPINVSFTVENPHQYDTYMWIVVTDIPDTWSYNLDWDRETILRKSTKENNITIFPPTKLDDSEMRFIHDVGITVYFYCADAHGATHVCELGSVIASVSPAEKTLTNINPPNCSSDGRCTATGNVDRGMVGDPVTVIFTTPKGEEILITSYIIDQSGAFSNSITPASYVDSTEGTWTARAVYVGGPHLEGSFSNSVDFDVSKDTQPTTRLTVDVNESHTFTGSVENGQIGDPITLVFISPSGESYEIVSKITTNSEYAVDFTANETGEWIIRYTYEGREVSETFEVEEERRSSIPSVGIFATLSTLFISAIIVGRRLDN